MRHRALKIAETHHRLSKNPSLQAETLALHYLSLATTAQHLWKLIETRRQSHSVDNTDELDKLIGFMTHQIKEAHAQSLGIELKWDSSDQPLTYE